MCKKQKLAKTLGPEIVRQIEKAIFDQRPLKSQKGQVGKCVIEKQRSFVRYLCQVIMRL